VRRGKRERGFTLIEAVLIVLMIALAVPPAVRMMTEASAERADRVLLAAAMSYAQGIADQVMADVSGGGLAVLDDAGAYLASPGTGLWDRLSWISEPYEARHLTESVDVSEAVGWRGAVAADESENLYRVVTVRVGVPMSDGELVEVPVALMLGEPNP
jgi:type II secretory pathway pseudopilin PulG